METLKSIIFVSVFATIFALHPNDPRAYLSTEAFRKIEFDLKWIETNVSETSFHLYEKGAGQPFRFTAETNPEELLNHGFSANKPTKMFVHGWVHPALDYCQDFVDAYDLDEINAICINFEKLATFDNYIQAALNAVNVGRYSGEHLGARILLEGLGQRPDQLHIIGHSLGAHLCGQFGRRINELGHGKIARVTGLDPAKPFFDLASDEYTINIGDAVLVDIIHTNSGTLLDGALSMPEPLGHLDFYPNGGTHQAGCTQVCVGTACLGFDLIDIFKGACSHKRAHKYYVESAERSGISRTFISTQCDSYVEFIEGLCSGQEHLRLSMGEALDITSLDENQEPMSLYLRTAEEEPFSLTSSIE